MCGCGIRRSGHQGEGIVDLSEVVHYSRGNNQGRRQTTGGRARGETALKWRITNVGFLLRTSFPQICETFPESCDKRGVAMANEQMHAIRFIITFVCVLIASSCAKSSKPDDVVSDRGYPISFDETFYVVVETSFDDAWARARAALEDLGWPIDTESETSGMVTTDVVEMGTNRDRYACRQWTGSRTRLDVLRCKLIVQVTPSDETAIRVRARADIEGRYVYWTSRGDERVGGWWQCTSTGEIESEFFDAFLARFEPLQYEEPLFRPGVR